MLNLLLILDPNPLVLPRILSYIMFKLLRLNPSSQPKLRNRLKIKIKNTTIGNQVTGRLQVTKIMPLKFKIKTRNYIM